MASLIIELKGNLKGNKLMSETKKSPGRPKKAAIPVIETPAVDAEKEQLKEQMAEMQKQMELMRQMLMQNAGVSAQPQPKKKDRMIRFVNLVPGTVVLRGSVIWKIEGQFATHDFLETEAAIIVNNMANAVRNGLVYIADAEFVEEHNLADVYRYILSDEALKNLLSQDSKYIIEAYKTANDNQKQIILDMIEEKRMAGEQVDANVLFQLGKESGRNLLEDEPENEEN